MIDARKTDGFIAIGTHGNGVYSAFYNPATGIEESNSIPSLQVGNFFPNPVQDAAQLEVITKKTLHLKATLYSSTGKLIKVVTNKTIHPGKEILSCQFGELPVGVYYLVLKDGRETIVKRVVKIAHI